MNDRSDLTPVNQQDLLEESRWRDRATVKVSKIMQRHYQTGMRVQRGSELGDRTFLGAAQL